MSEQKLFKDKHGDSLKGDKGQTDVLLLFYAMNHKLQTLGAHYTTFNWWKAVGLSHGNCCCSRGSKQSPQIMLISNWTSSPHLRCCRNPVGFQIDVNLDLATIRDPGMRLQYTVLYSPLGASCPQICAGHILYAVEVLWNLVHIQTYTTHPVDRYIRQTECSVDLHNIFLFTHRDICAHCHPACTQDHRSSSKSQWCYYMYDHSHHFQWHIHQHLHRVAIPELSTANWSEGHMYNYMNMALTKTDMVISTAERESMVTATRIVARSVCTPLVATCCAFNTFIDICMENVWDREDQMRRHSCRPDSYHLPCTHHHSSFHLGSTCTQHYNCRSDSQQSCGSCGQKCGHPPHTH